MEIKVTDGTPNITVCGITDGTSSCSGSTGCGTLNAEAETYTVDNFLFCVPHDGTFRVTNNDGSSILISLTIGSNTLPDQPISGSSSEDFEIVNECESIDPC